MTQRKEITKAKRIVIKIGTSTIAYETGLVNIRRIEQLVKVIADLKNSGKEIIIVTSGAIGIGMGKLKLKQRPKDTPTKQALAAIGQCELMYIYDKLFSVYNHNVAQVLVTKDIVNVEEIKNNATNTFAKLLESGSIPIVNENDAIATEEIEFGDNDTLSACVASLIKADALILLTDIDGLYNKNPKTNDDAVLISHVTKVTEEIENAAGGTTGLGTGGMATKVEAAKIATRNGVDMMIINSNDPENLYRVFDGEEIGTYFHAEIL